MIYFLLFIEFFKIGLFTIGGGYAMIPLIKETVINHGWLTEECFYDFLGVAESTPGPIAINMATYIGSSNAGILGSICSTLGVVLPSFIIIILIASLLKKLIDNKVFKNALTGINAVVLGLILSTGIIMVYNLLGLDNIHNLKFNYKYLIIMVLLVLIYYLYKLIFKKKMPTILLILISAGIGIVTFII